MKSNRKHMQIFVSVPERKWKKNSTKRQKESWNSMDLKRKAESISGKQQKKSERISKKFQKQKEVRKAVWEWNTSSSGNRRTIKTAEVSS